MTDDDMIIALYHDGDPERPNETGIALALAAVIQAMTKLKGREHVADLLELTADGVRSGELGEHVEPERPICH